jgi:F-type H+-transporting ATPase subunit epsilon
VSAFRLVLQATTEAESVDGVTSFVGEDRSGSFGLLPRHARFMTVLVFGLARFRCGDSPWEYLALPGGLLYFTGDTLTIATRRFLRGNDYERISDDLQKTLLSEEEQRRTAWENVQQLEEAMLRRLWQMRRRP